MEEKEMVSPLPKTDESIPAATAVSDTPPTPPDNSKPKKSKLPWIIGGVVVFAFALAGAFFFFNNNKQTVNTRAKVYRVGIIALNAFGNMQDGFKAKMTELGYIEGKNIVYDIRRHSIDLDGMQKSLDDFVLKKVDLVFTEGTPPSLMAKTTMGPVGIPVVFDNAGLSGNNLVESVQQPGGNITGVQYPGSDIVVKRLEFLLEVVPTAKRVWVAYQSTNPSALGAIGPLRSAAKSKGVILVEVPLEKVTDIDLDLQARAKSEDIGIDAILIMPEGFTQSPPGWPVIKKFASEQKIPIGGSAAFAVYDGAIFSYGPDNFQSGEMAAPLADKIFKGVPAGTIPVVTPESLLRINYKTAQEMGIKVPEGLLSQAVEIIR